MPIPAVLAALGPLLAEGAAGATAAGATAATAESAAAAAASSEGMAAALAQGMQGLGGGGGGGEGGLSGYGLGGKVPSSLKGGLVGKLFGSLIKPLTTIPKQIEDWGDSLLESKRGLMAFNGAIAGTLLEAERRDIVRKMEEGERLSSTTGFLSEGLSDLKDEIQPIKDVVSNGFNVMAGIAVRILSTGTWIVKNLPGPIAAVLWMQEHWPGGGNEDSRTEFVKFIDDIKAGGLRQFNDPDDLMKPPGF